MAAERLRRRLEGGWSVVRIPFLHICIGYECMYICMCVYECMYVCMYVCVSMYVFVYVCIYVCMCVYEVC